MPLFLGLFAVITVAYFASRGGGSAPIQPRSILVFSPTSARYFTSYRQVYELNRVGTEGTDGAWIGIGPMNARGQAIAPASAVGPYNVYPPTYGKTQGDLITNIEAKGFLPEG